MAKTLTPAQAIERARLTNLVFDIMIDKLGIDDPEEQKLLTEERTLDDDVETGLGVDSLGKTEILMELERRLDTYDDFTDSEEDIKTVGQLIDAALEKSRV